MLSALLALLLPVTLMLWVLLQVLERQWVSGLCLRHLTSLLLPPAVAAPLQTLVSLHPGHWLHQLVR
jgi:hypothetical protein